ncbi:MAG: ABC transporter permease [Flavobacteriales bacterium]|nr:ABC transporter permease [Flavobacteriales bacterium]
MFDRDKWYEILQVVLQNPLRAVLSGLGVSWGIFMLIITVGSATGLENGVKADMSDVAKNSAFMWTQSTSMPYKGFSRGRYLRITNADVEYMRENLQKIELVCPRNEIGGYQGTANVIRGINTGAFSVYGDYPEFPLIKPMKIVDGRFINYGDIHENRKVCVIGSRVRTVLFPDGEDPKGQYIQIFGVGFQVVGVFDSLAKGEDAEEETASIFTPFTTFQKAFNQGDEVGWLSILLKEDVPTEEAVTEIKDMIKQRLSIHPDDPRAIGYWSMAEELEDVNNVFSGFAIVSFTFGFLVLLAGVIGIINIMLITVKERTKEIGVRRSLGATPVNIIFQIIYETVFLTVISGAAGMIFGVFALEGVNILLQSMGDTGSFRNPGIEFKTVVTALSIMIVMGGFAGLIPALRAVSIKPVDALRAE